MPKSALMRNNMMLGQLLTNDIGDKRILDAMTAIPREPFLPEALRGAAYVDEDLSVGNGRYIMEPLVFARLLDLARVAPDCRVLVIGCLTGYSAAILSKLAAHVTAIDSDETAIQQARGHMERLTLSNVNLHHVKNMAEGYPLSAPYNIIVIGGAIDVIPETLSKQLAIGGRLVCVQNISKRVGSKGGLGKGLLVTRFDHTMQHREHFDASCPILPGFELKPGFSF